MNNSDVPLLDLSDASSVSADIVLSQTAYTYDADSNILLTITRDRFNTDSTSSVGALGSPTSGIGARVSYVADYYDASDRLTDEVNVGTNGGSAYTRPGSVPTASSTVLVTHTHYDDAGNANLITDPRGVAKIDNSDGGSPPVGSAQTDYTYDGDDHVLTMTAEFPGTMTPSQTTAYVYGITGTAGHEPV